MRALVVYESMFGNTAAVADAIRMGLETWPDVTAELLEVGQAPHEIDDTVDVIVIGGPTHTFGMSRPETRDSAKDERPEPVISAGNGIREWIAAVTAPAGVLFATFATKIRGPFPGSAGKSAAHDLSQRGWKQLVPPENFRVLGKVGPLVDDEERRAFEWGRTVVAAAAAEWEPTPTRHEPLPVPRALS